MGHYFSDEDFEARELAPGVRTRILSRGSLMFSIVEIEAGAVAPLHRHDEEQMGLILEGEFERWQGDDVRVLAPGEGFYVAPRVKHGGRAIHGAVRILDVFTPPRDVRQRLT